MTNLIKSFTYGEDITEKTAVKFQSEGVVEPATSQTDNICGIALFTGSKGAKGDILMLGLGLVATTGSVNAGDLLISDENGKLKTFSTEDFEESTNVTVVAKSLETASTDAFLNALVNPQFVSVHVDSDSSEN